MNTKRKPESCRKWKKSIYKLSEKEENYQKKKNNQKRMQNYVPQ